MLITKFYESQIKQKLLLKNRIKKIFLHDKKMTFVDNICITPCMKLTVPYVCAFFYIVYCLAKNKIRVEHAVNFGYIVF